MPKAAGQVRTEVQPDCENGLEAARRLNEKILSAFTHAYAIGEVEVAERLRDVLVLNTEKRVSDIVVANETDPLCQADLWVRFVEARNRYKAACDGGQPDPATANEALEAMKEAYREWSQT